ncbi:MAG TPA: T9SS type A sorting domain-containing protein, partial [Panacibacter sp.]|nr:T9SS type A sorting domain-containing protein [Panacibacter sp.]
VPLVKAVQELSKKNDEKDEAIADLQKQIDQLKILLAGNSQQVVSTDQVLKNNVQEASISLEQNAPNPFNSNTVIRYRVPASAATAQIVITDLKGNAVKIFTLTNKGAGSVMVNAGELTAGSYYYTLTVEGKKADSKKMILVK